MDETQPARFQEPVDVTHGKIIRATRLAWICVAVGFVFLVYGFVHLPPTADNLDALGSYLQGAVGSFWALAGLILIYVAFLGQKLQLHYQQEELEATREELRGQKQQLEAQNMTFKRQNFETTFFHLLHLHGSLVTSFEMEHSAWSPSLGSHKTRTATARNCFAKWHDSLKQGYQRHKTAKMKANEAISEPVLIAMGYNELYSRHEAELGHYFRNLYQIIKFVKTSDVPDKKTYTSVL
jgi:hypothetical protein